MADVRFYHLQKSSLEQALPQLLEKALERGLKTVVFCESAERVETLNQHLWAYRPASFLPHGSASDGFSEHQPIWLTSREENPSNASVLMVVGGADGPSSIDAYDLCCILFDGNDPEAVSRSREQWTALKKDARHTLSYWQQTPTGWEKKITT